MFAIIENKKQFPCSDGPSDGLGGNPVAAQLQVEPPRHRGWHQAGIQQRGQLDQPNVTLKAREQAAGHLQCQLGFPDSPGPGQRDHPVGGQKIKQMLLGSASANQVGRRRGQIVHKWLDWKRSDTNRVC